MAVTIIATPKAANANSYTTLVDAETYIETNLYATEWDAATDDQKNRSLVTATRLLDEQVEWNAWPTTTTQALLWPQRGQVDLIGNIVDEDTIPQFLVNATSEFAKLLLVSDRTAEPDTTGYKRLKVDVLELEVDKNDRASIIPDSVYQIIKPYGEMKEKKPLKVYRT